jgi:hypothetical protein
MEILAIEALKLSAAHVLAEHELHDLAAMGCGGFFALRLTLYKAGAQHSQSQMDAEAGAVMLESRFSLGPAVHQIPVRYPNFRNCCRIRIRRPGSNPDCTRLC